MQRVFILWNFFFSILWLLSSSISSLYVRCSLSFSLRWTFDARMNVSILWKTSLIWFLALIRYRDWPTVRATPLRWSDRPYELCKSTNHDVLTAAKQRPLSALRPSPTFHGRARPRDRWGMFNLWWSTYLWTTTANQPPLGRDGRFCCPKFHAEFLSRTQVPAAIREPSLLIYILLNMFIQTRWNEPRGRETFAG